MKPFVSVIIPVYNVEKYLKQCIDSILCQTLENIEILCIDDGSTDSCPEMLDEYARQDGRITVVHKENSGYGHTMNVGMDMAKGEYIGIVESDDFICESMFEVLYGKAKEHNLDAVKANYLRIYEDESGKIHMHPWEIASSPSDYNRIISFTNEDNKISFSYANWSGIYRTEFLKNKGIKHNETPGASYQDVGFCTQVMAFSERLMYIDDYFYCYRIDNPNASMKSSAKVYCLFSEYEFLHKRLKCFPQIYETFKKILTCRCLLEYTYGFVRIDDIHLHQLISYMSGYLAQSRKDGLFSDEWFTTEQKLFLDSMATQPHKTADVVLRNKQEIMSKRAHARELIERKNGTVIYGAGIYGKTLFDYLVELHLAHKVNCYAVTNCAGQRMIRNKEVKCIDEIGDKSNTLVIVAVSPSRSAEHLHTMQKRASDLGFKNIVSIDEVMCLDLVIGIQN